MVGAVVTHGGKVWELLQPYDGTVWNGCSESYFRKATVEPDRCAWYCKKGRDFYLLGSEGAPLRTAVIFFYIANEGVSLLENTMAIGLPMPEKLKEILAQLHGKGENK